MTPLRILTVIVALAGLVVTGCAPTATPLYNFDSYSESYYAFKKNLSDESALQLQKSLEEAIEKKGESRSGRVPPGMYANLGYLYLKSGKAREAIANFEQEKATYPESTLFMDRVIQKVELAEGGKK